MKKILVSVKSFRNSLTKAILNNIKTITLKKDEIIFHGTKDLSIAITTIKDYDFYSIHFKKEQIERIVNFLMRLDEQPISIEFELYWEDHINDLNITFSQFQKTFNA